MPFFVNTKSQGSLPAEVTDEVIIAKLRRNKDFREVEVDEKEPEIFVPLRYTLGENLSSAAAAADAEGDEKAAMALIKLTRGNPSIVSQPARPDEPPEPPENIAPVIEGLYPGYVEIGSADVTLTVSGDGFTDVSVIVFDGLDATTTYVSAKELTTLVLPSVVSEPEIVSVLVRNGTAKSGPVDFEFTAPAAAPAGTRKRKGR